MTFEALPSVNELVQGLLEIVHEQVDEIYTRMSKDATFDPLRAMGVKRFYSDLANRILKIADIPESDDPIKLADLQKPNSKICCYVLYLYSMETGRPPLYSIVNNACRDLDTARLRSVGPFARVMHEILSGSEKNRAKGDRIPTISTNLTSFLLFRGASMKKEWL